MQSSSSPFLVNIVPLANVVTNSSGLDPVTQLSNTVANIQQMVNYDKKTIYTNYLGAFPGTNSITVTSPLVLSNVGITSNTTSSSSTATTNIQANSITASTITVGGTCYAQAFVTLSDKGVKGDVRPLPKISFDTLSSIGTYKYKYLDGIVDEIGIFAQELEAVYPECIKLGPGSNKYINYPSLVAILLQAVKDLDERLKVLEMRA